jgi:hypothetical protein
LAAPPCDDADLFSRGGSGGVWGLSGRRDATAIDAGWSVREVSQRQMAPVTMVTRPGGLAYDVAIRETLVSEAPKMDGVPDDDTNAEHDHQVYGLREGRRRAAGILLNAVSSSPQTGE